MITQHPALLFWDFKNVVSERGISTAVGIPTDPGLISGFIAQTGGGPAEVFGDGAGTVFLTRYLGSNEVYLWFTITRTVNIGSITLRHWHNHNPGFPTHPSYRVQLQIDLGEGYVNCGSPLHLSNKNSGGFDVFSIGRVLSPGSYKLRWHPQALKNKARDTGSEFFAFNNLTLHGHVYEYQAAPAPVCPAPEPGSPPAAVTEPGHITLTLGGQTVGRLKVMESRFPGKCVRSGEEFDSGALIGFKHRNALTEAESAAVFGAGQRRHLVVRLTREEIAAVGRESDEPLSADEME
ncbi:MAG TPA: hypothetical protein VGE74_29040 [Gemmata sp.]